ncbi:MAG: sucrase ferredoxin [Microthrixaceae bacterium]
MAPYSCTAAARERAEPMFATASGVRRWLLVEVRGPWGHNAPLDSDLGDVVDAAWLDGLKGRGIRTITVRRNLCRTDGPADVELIYVDPAVAGARPGRAWHQVVGSMDEVAAATAELAGVERRGAPAGWLPWADPINLVCTNGRHDACCATFGRPLVRHLREGRWADVTWESSHVGGDRFAANLVVLPDSLYFGRCDPDAAEAVLAAHQQGRIHLPNYRGRSTLGFAHQAADYFVRTELGLDGIDDVGAIHRRTATDQPGSDVLDGTSTPLEFTVDTVAGPIEVRLTRDSHESDVPITCKGPAGLSYPVYRLVSIRNPRPGAADRRAPTAPAGSG